MARYILFVHEPDEDSKRAEMTANEAQLQRNLPRFLREIEENLTDLLPYGYYATIEEKE
jgi:hypothetical protein